ncbi:RhuM family protein [Methanoculleus nereidis]|uniref:RhuM family protein n=1 Tax=Methanoculleus nereidis TaxID=2735141 RepID=UPI00374DBC76
MSCWSAYAVIRSSEKVFYRQVLDLYATSVDYDPRTPESLEFFKIRGMCISPRSRGIIRASRECDAGRDGAHHPGYHGRLLLKERGERVPASGSP